VRDRLAVMHEACLFGEIQGYLALLHGWLGSVNAVRVCKCSESRISTTVDN
jgi:hypothetical protein